MQRTRTVSPAVVQEHLTANGDSFTDSGVDLAHTVLMVVLALILVAGGSEAAAFG